MQNREPQPSSLLWCCVGGGTGAIKLYAGEALVDIGVGVLTALEAALLLDELLEDPPGPSSPTPRYGRRPQP